MTTLKNFSQNPDQSVELEPNYVIPLVLIFGGMALGLIQWWLTVIISLFGIFLLIQAATLRLRFTETALEIYRLEKQIRYFPYAEWQNWRIFWGPVPILFYFKEIKSIHFLPIIFDPEKLKESLQPLPRID